MRGLGGIQGAHIFQRASISNGDLSCIHCMLRWSKKMILPGVMVQSFTMAS